MLNINHEVINFDLLHTFELVSALIFILNCILSPIRLAITCIEYYSAYRNSVNIAFLRLFLYVQTNRRINIRI